MTLTPKTRQTVEEDHRRLSAALMQSDEPVALTDEEARYIYANPAFCKLFGYELHELMGKSISLLMPPEDISGATVRQTIADALKQGAFHDEVRRRTKDGRIIPILLKVSPFQNEQGGLMGYIATMTDLTEIKRMENALRESEKHFRDIIEHAPLGMVTLTLDGRFIQVNQAFCDIVGYPKEALENLSFNAITHPDDINISLENIQKLIAGKINFYRIEKRYFHKDGHTVWAQVDTSLQRDSSGDPLNLISQIKDITAHKQAEIALKRESEKNLVLLRNASDGIHILNADGNIIEVSDSFCTMLGYRRDEMIGMNVSQWDAKFSATEITQVFRQQFARPERSQFETLHRRKDGTIFDVEVSGFPLELDGKPVMFNSSRDITERKKAEEILRKSREQLKSFIQHAPIRIAMFDRDMNYLATSDRWVTEHALGNTDIVGRNHYEVNPDTPNKWKIAHQQALTGATVKNNEDLWIHADGNKQWLRWEVSPWVDEYGMIGGVIITSEDITEYKKQEWQLKQMSFAMNHVNESVFLLDEDGHFLYVNDEACRVLGYTREEFLDGMGLPDIGPGWSYEKWKEHWQDVKSRKSIIFEGSQLTRHGRVLPVEVSANYFEYDGICFAMGLVRDITERKKNEKELRIAATAFESQEGMLISDANNVILRVNQAFTAITGYTAEEVIGKNPRILSSGRQDADFYAAMWRAINKTGTWGGEIWNRRKNGEIYPEHLSVTAVKNRDGVVTNYVASLSDITLRKAAEEEIQYLAFYDPLTKLPNRRLLQDRLRQTLASSARSGRQGALLFIDLDNFKSLNDTLGHAIGDLLLQQVAQRLGSCVREGDTLSRFGGDEFVVILEDLSEEVLEAAAQTEAVGEKIIAALNQLYHLAAYEYHCTISIGVTLLNEKQNSIDELLKQADIAMYQAKNSGRNTLRFFDQKMQDIVNSRADIEDELRKAIENRQFNLYYQIQVDSSRRSIGAEALIRWIHPERGLVSPAQFIPISEETGLIVPIGQWVLETACIRLKAWQLDVLTRDLVLSVNISAKQLHQADFVAQVQSLVQFHAINPKLLKLELTESMLLENIEDTIVTMSELKEIGVQFSLDDFGTGYSSLQYLKRLPLDQLKIDQSFVRDIAIDSNDRAIVQTIIAMAQSLNLSIIAEGVETKEQQKLLMEKGCTNFQGYLFSKPVPIEQFEALLKQSSEVG